MALPKVRLDSKGIEEIAKGAAMQRAIKLKTEQVAIKVRGMGIRVGAFEGGGEIDLPVETSQTTTDRAHGSVTIAHPAGQAVQAKHGALTKAAAQAGLDVKDESQ